MQLKVSRYTLEIPAGSVTYLVNTLSGASIAFGDAERRGLDAILAEVAASGVARPEQGRVAGLLFESGFLVPADADELAAALEKYDRGRSDPSVVSLVIATTMECNMGCHYCYQDRTSSERLGGPDVDAIVRFVADRLPENGRLNVTWFGGEPLLAKDFVLETSRALMRLTAGRQAHYSASMVSNGYNLDLATARELRDHRVGSVQVTLDGQQEHHDTVRKHLLPVSGNRVGSYARIVENISRVADTIRIGVRVNVSRRNASSVKMLIDDLAAAGLADKLGAIYFAPLFNYKVTDQQRGYQPREDVHFTMRDFAELEADLLEHAAARGFKLQDWADPSYAGCIAVARNGFVIDSNGEVKKCDHELGEPGTAISSLRDPAVFGAANEQKWDEYRPESNAGCDTCVLLPVCYSHCPHKNMESPHGLADKCPSHKFNWQRTLPLVLKQRADQAAQPADGKADQGESGVLQC